MAPDSATETSITPPRGVYLDAFVSRFSDDLHQTHRIAAHRESRDSAREFGPDGAMAITGTIALDSEAGQVALGGQAFEWRFRRAFALSSSTLISLVAAPVVRAVTNTTNAPGLTLVKDLRSTADSALLREDRSFASTGYRIACIVSAPQPCNGPSGLRRTSYSLMVGWPPIS